MLRYLCNDRKFFKYSSIQYILISIFNDKNIKKALKLEISAQINLFKKNFKKLNIDGHQHIHFVPVVFFQILKLNKKFKISFIRNSSEKIYLRSFLYFKKYYFLNILKVFFLNIMSFFLKKYLLRNNISYNDQVYGILNSGNLNKNLIKNMKKKLDPDNETIFILHPGYKNKKKNKNHEMNYYYKKERKIEFNLIKEIKNIL